MYLSIKLTLTGPEGSRSRERNRGLTQGRPSFEEWGLDVGRGVIGGPDQTATPTYGVASLIQEIVGAAVPRCDRAAGGRVDREHPQIAGRGDGGGDRICVPTPNFVTMAHRRLR